MNPVHLLKVVHVEHFTADIIRLLMRPDFPLVYAAGQYILLGFEQSDLKPFSIAAAPRDDGLIECHIRKHDDNPWMQRLFAVQVGDILVMQGPKDQMQWHAPHQPVIFVAGGTGFAPLKALLEEHLRHHIDVPLHFYWGARQAKELYMHDAMLALERNHANLIYIPVVSETDPDWQGRTGLVHLQVLQDFASLAHKTVYLCGPWAMVQTAKADFAAAGLSEGACFA